MRATPSWRFARGVTCQRCTPNACSTRRRWGRATAATDVRTLEHIASATSLTRIEPAPRLPLAAVFRSHPLHQGAVTNSMKMKKLEACFKAQARGSTLRWFIRTYKTPCCKALAPALGGLTDAQRSSCDPTRVCSGHLIAIENLRDVLKKRELLSAASGSGATSQSAQPVPRPHVRSGLKTKSAIARADPAVLANAARQREAAKRQSDALDAQRRRAGARQRAEQMVPTAIGGVGLAESMTAAVGHTLADDQRDAHTRTKNSTNARKHAKRAARRAEARAIKEREERVEEAT